MFVKSLADECQAAKVTGAATITAAMKALHLGKMLR
jgi:hypothetical protein